MSEQTHSICRVDLVPVQFKTLFMRYLECLKEDYKSSAPIPYGVYYASCMRSEAGMQHFLAADPRHLRDSNYIFAQLMRMKQMCLSEQSSLNKGNWMEKAVESFQKDLKDIEDVGMYMSGKRNPFEVFTSIEPGSPASDALRRYNHSAHITIYRIGLMKSIHGGIDLIGRGVVDNVPCPQ